MPALPELCSLRCRQHIIFYLDEELPIVIAVFHENMDIMSRLRKRYGLKIQGANRIVILASMICPEASGVVEKIHAHLAYCSGLNPEAAMIGPQKS